MRRRSNSLVLTALLIIVAVLLVAPTASAQDRTLAWPRWDVDININSDGSFDVRETYEIEFIGGPFTFGYREIPTDQVEALQNFSVSDQSGTTYSEAFSERPNTFYVTRDGSDQVITWYFPPATNETRIFMVEYTVVGGLIISEDVGERFFWKAIGPDHAYPIGSSTVTVTLPPGATVDRSIEPATFGPAATYEISQDGTTVTYYAEDIRANQEFEVGVRFPHGFVPAEKPAWQAEYEQEQTWNDRFRPIFNLGLGALAVLILGGGLLGVYFLWSGRGRDPDVGPVPEYLSEPPSDLPPGVVGTLLDEQADMQDIIATLIDLARRGVIEMQEIDRPVFLGLTSTKQFVFRRVGSDDSSLRPYEKTLISKMFGRKQEVELEDLQNKFYTAIPTLQNQLYEEAVKLDLFPKNPKSVRSRWLSLGVVGLVVAFGVGFCAAGVLVNRIEAILCPFVALGIVSTAMLIASRAMPVKTRHGAEEAAKWSAFKTYLQNTEYYTDLKEVTDQFDKYLPYAIALGLERTWLNKFSRVPGTPIPPWYYPVGMPYGTTRGVPGGTVMGRPGAAGGGSSPRDVRGDAVRPSPSLDTMSEGLAGGLGSMSAGLSSMLNSAANTFRSVPSSSSGGGGRGFSGGGFSGGGFSGGGGGGGGGAGFG